jgi:hypothetical protein
VKLSTLKDWFLHRSRRTKLYVIDGAAPPQFVLAGFAFNPREEGDALTIDVDPYVVYSIGRDAVLQPERPFLGLRLAPGSEVTRKFQTHCRNVRRVVPESAAKQLAHYLEVAWNLRDDDRGGARARARPGPAPRDGDETR